MSTKPAQAIVYMPAETLSQLKFEHGRTYGLHRLSFSAWLLSRIQLSFAIKDEAVNPPKGTA